MKQKLFALYDKVAEQFGPIFQAVNINTAVRTVQNMKIRAYEDFDLFMVGEWDMESGLLKVTESMDAHKRVEWVTQTYINEIKTEQKTMPFAGIPK